MKPVILIALCGLVSPIAPALGADPQSVDPSSAARNETPASQTKARLIRRYLELVGVQQEIDSGSLLERYALPGSPLWPGVAGQVSKSEDLLTAIEGRMAALKAAYAKHRRTFQQKYEDHVNWEFTEAELIEIVGFLEQPVGKHFLAGRWRMDAYVRTNTEELEQQIVAEARASLAK